MSEKLKAEMANAGLELAMYASYSEIIGGISHNRAPIRKWCDEVFRLNRELQAEEWTALEAAHAATVSS